MKNTNIFKKIDEIYTKITQVIIGDMPLEIDDISHAKKEKITTPKQNGIKNIFTAIKTKILTLGETNEKSLLYKEVVKREKQAADKTVSKIETKPIVTQKTIPVQETTTSQTETKKKVVKSKPVSKKTPMKKETLKKTAPKKRMPIAEKETTNKIESHNKVSKKTGTTKATPKGAKKAAKIALYTKDIKKHYGEVDEEFLAIIVKNLGPSIYKKDAELVSCSDPKELDTVRKNFLINKLGIDASHGVLNAAIQDVCEELKATRTKYRATFYYALAKKFKKESVLS